MCLLSAARPGGLPAQRAIGGAQSRTDAILVVAPSVDTLAADRREALRLLRAYRSQSVALKAQAALWSQLDAIDRDYADLTRGFVTTQRATLESMEYDGAKRSTLQMRLRYGPAIAPGMVLTLYAVRPDTGTSSWRLSGALSQRTRGWERQTNGRLTFLYAPGLRPDTHRAVTAAQFADSVARMFDVPPPPNILFVLTPSPASYMRLLGVESTIDTLDARKPGSLALGTSPTGNGLVLSGDPTLGELNKHEIAHAVLGGIFGSAFPSEGVASWLGGSYGRTREALFAELLEFQRRNPALSISQLLGDVPALAQDEVRMIRNATGARAVQEVYRRRKLAGLRGLRNVPTMTPEDWLRLQLGISPNDSVALDRWWRAAALRAAGAGR